MIIAAPGLPRDRLVGIFYRVQPYVRKTSLIPDLFGIPIANVKTERSLDDTLKSAWDWEKYIANK